ncbi:MAG: toxin-antitoxin system YwqK family antitoxin [Spirochaetes bacterium]|nr:toxin-antitoxin system YwqK family antitoxin [Spirochaetota bacterium]
MRRLAPLTITALLFLAISCESVQNIQTPPSPQPTPYESLVLKLEPGTKEGIHTLHWPDGSIMARGPVKRGTKQGPWEIYYMGSNGTRILASGTYAGDRKEGFWQRFNEKGTLTERIPYRRGIIEGERIFYYPSGRVQFEYQYRGNRKNGKAGEYDETGSPIEIAWYNNDKRDGMSNLYYPDGKKKSIGRYSAGVRNGQWTNYDETGILKERGDYRNGHKSGLWRTFDRNGRVVEEKQF